MDKCHDDDYADDDINCESIIVNASANKYEYYYRMLYNEMNILIKHLENNWTIKKNIHNCSKNKNTKEYILKKNTGRDVKMKIIKINNFEQTSKEEEYKNGENPSENKNKLNVKLSDNCLRNFIYNALENEWKLKKIDNKYFCSKRHKGDKRVYEAGYLKEFLLDNFTF
jgi:hypothetical protein